MLDSIARHTLASYSPFSGLDKKKEIRAQLAKYDLETILLSAEQAIEQRTVTSKSIGIWTACLVTTISEKVHAGIPDLERQGGLLAIQKHVFEMCMELLRRQREDSLELVSEIEKSSSQACLLMDAAFNPFARVIELCHLYTILHGSTGKVTDLEAPGYVKPMPIVLWTKKGRLEELVHQLLERKWISSSSRFFDLFEESRQQEVLVKWDMRFKMHLAHLWHELYVKGIIHVKRTKGYFRFAEAHFVGKNGEVLTCNSLKRRSSAVNQDTHKYKQVHAAVQVLLSTVVR